MSGLYEISGSCMLFPISGSQEHTIMENFPKRKLKKKKTVKLWEQV